MGPRTQIGPPHMAGDLAQSLANPDHCNTNLLPIPRPLAITLSTRKHDTTNSRFLPRGREFSSTSRAFVCDWFSSLLSTVQKWRVGRLALVYFNELTRLQPRMVMQAMKAMLICRFGSSLSRLVPAWQGRAVARGRHAHQLFYFGDKWRAAEKNGKKPMTGQDSERASGAASARTCARDAQVAHPQKPFWPQMSLKIG